MVGACWRAASPSASTVCSPVSVVLFLQLQEMQWGSNPLPARCFFSAGSEKCG